MMKQRISIFLLFTILLSANGYAQKGIMRLTQQTLMHEVRETPSPLDGQHITVNPPRFMWPDKFPHLGAVLDGVEEEDYKTGSNLPHPDCTRPGIQIGSDNRRKEMGLFQPIQTV